MSELCLTLLCSPAVEEKLLDLLLMSPEVTVFTSTVTAAHGRAVSSLNQAEQVMGRAVSSQVQVILAASSRTALLEDVRQQFTGTGLRYWVTPVVEAGEIV